MITQLPSKPVTPSYDKIPHGEIILYHGLPKSGKTTCSASWPDNCMIEVEKSGAKWVEGAYVIEPENLEDINQIIKLLRADKRFKCVTLDTVDTLSLWIEKYICQKYGVTSISLAGGGYGIGRNELNTMLIGLIDDLVSLGKTLILISHCRDNQGTKSLLLTETLLVYIQGKASIIGYSYKELKGGKLEFLIDYSGRGSASVSGSRHPLIARSEPIENSYKALEALFEPKPEKWFKMLKWYEKNGVSEGAYLEFVKEKFGVDVKMETLLPNEVKQLITIGAKHTKDPDDFDTFKNRYVGEMPEKGD